MPRMMQIMVKPSHNTELRCPGLSNGSDKVSQYIQHYGSRYKSLHYRVQKSPGMPGI